MESGIKNIVVADEAGFSFKKVEASADICELLALSFSFPSLSLAEAIVSGSFQADAMSCLEELEQLEGLDALERGFDTLRAGDPQELYTHMKREYSRLFLSPGKLAVIYPYEGAFLYKKRGGKGAPTLFINPATIDVESYMKKAEALPENARVEPVDSVFCELDFLRLLYTRVLADLPADPESKNNQARCSLDLAEEFRAKHPDKWIYDFMQETKEHSRIEIYRLLAELGLVFFKMKG